ncbi:hypothetical protein RJP21_21560 [Paenibacillus sp. VCA1]|uniref:HEAT repeat domain-containing protein n=1 Tax=Paenibacillus sp. VCA1 TaxID=3039148 RepID=UPI002872575B|nr:hypothetical protein [Paenibacillus sp. VCA1]MDR9856194.1 hypothetical protein [Paenibacillus sp. VCA1]
MNEYYRYIHDSTKSLEIKIDEQVDEFWQWSKTQKQVNEWEASYSEWSLINTLLDRLVRFTDFTQWDQRTINNILYLIARNNECETLIDTISENPACLIYLSREGLKYQDDNARWQLVHYLSKIIVEQPEAERLILMYCDDHIEYVRRRALLALGDIKSEHAEQKAIEAWSSNLEYQRIAALETLYQVESRELEKYLQLGLQDSFDYVRMNAERILKLLRD